MGNPQTYVEQLSRHVITHHSNQTNKQTLRKCEKVEGNMASLMVEGAYFRQIETSEYYVDTNMDNMLGQGAVGTVVLGYFREQRKQIAAKKITVLDEEEFIREFEREGTILKRLRHENVIKVYDVNREKVMIEEEAHVNIWIMMEYCPLGDVSKYCRKTEVSLRRKVEIMSECAHGLEYLHNTVRMTHRDIKPQNVLIAGTLHHNVAKLADFGTAKYLEYNAHDRTRTVHSIAGTEAYWAPELYRKEGGDPAPRYKQYVDIFSLGLTYLAVLNSSKGARLKPHQGENILRNIT